MMTYSTSVRPTKSKLIYRVGLAYLALGVVGLAYTVIIFQYPPVWNFVFGEIFNCILYTAGGMFFVVSSSNFDKHKYIVGSLVTGVVTALSALAGTVLAAVAAGYSKTDNCDCKPEPQTLGRSNAAEGVHITVCKPCGTEAHFWLYLILMFHCCLQFGVALWSVLHSYLQRRLHVTAGLTDASIIRVAT